MDLKNKIVLITGASSGIGEASAYEAIRRGAKPILVARRRSELERVALEVKKLSGENPLIIPADVTNPSDVKLIHDETERTFGRLDVLVNNAGITAHGRFDETNLDVLRKTMELNFFAVASLTQSLLPLLKKSPGEKAIVLVSTPSGLYGIPGRFAYSASKSAGHALMESLRIELLDSGIHTLIFCPGYTTTALRSSGLAADGTIIAEEQAREARSPGYAASRLWTAVEKKKRIVYTDFNGSVIYWLRTLAPGLLEKIAARKLKKDFQKRSHD